MCGSVSCPNWASIVDALFTVFHLFAQSSSNFTVSRCVRTPCVILRFTLYMVTFIFRVSGPMWMKRVILYCPDRRIIQNQSVCFRLTENRKSAEIVVDSWGVADALCSVISVDRYLGDARSGWVSLGGSTDLYADTRTDDTAATQGNRSSCVYTIGRSDRARGCQGRIGRTIGFLRRGGVTCRWPSD